MFFLKKGWERGIAMFEDDVLAKKPAGGFRPITERRSEPRVSLSVPARYRVLKKTNDWMPARTLDVSQNGVRLALHAEVPLGTRIDMEIKLPEIAESFHLQGVVVWIKDSQFKRTVECGVSFGSLRRASRREKLISFMADKLCHLATQQMRYLTCTPADSLEKLKTAYRLLYQEYLLRGYCQANPSKMHYNHFCVLPETRTFVLEKGDQLLGTLSLIIDSPCGLPMESLFPGEIGSLREENRRLAEVSLLALDHDQFPRKSFSLTNYQKLICTFHLFKLMFDYAHSAGVTDLVIAMHPKHKELYRYLTFEILGPVKSYPGACGNPALPMRMDIRKSRDSTPLERGLGSYFLRDSTPPEVLGKYFSWTEDSVFELLGHSQSLWPKISQASQSFLKTLYPRLASFDAEPTRS